MSDVGFHGVIVANIVSFRLSEDGGCGRIEENVKPGTVCVVHDERCDDVMYTVVAPDGKTLELMFHKVRE